MSHLARELDRQLVWIEKQERDLQAAVEDLANAGHSLMDDGQLWDDAQADTIRQAIRDWADNCGRSIANARFEANEFRKLLRQAHRVEPA